MNHQLMQVQMFHDKIGRPAPRPMPTNKLEDLIKIASEISSISRQLEKLCKMDRRYFYSHTILEETSEFIRAMAEGKESKAIDGLNDLLYFEFGAALDFDWPLTHTFEAVHNSNMSKTPNAIDLENGRIRTKGEYYQSPLPMIEMMLSIYRKKKGQ